MQSVREQGDFSIPDLLMKEELAGQLQENVRKQGDWMVLWHEAVAKKLGLNPTDHKCLNLILKSNPTCKEPRTPGALAREMRLTTGAVTGVLDRLERAGYVSREHDPEDRRRIIIKPTLGCAEHDVEPVIRWLQGAFSEQCARYDEAELQLLIDFVRDCQAIMQAATEQIV